MIDQGWIPHEEEFCRNLLVDRLKDRLSRLNIDVAREESKADDKRVDMSASFMQASRRISLPIEVKKKKKVTINCGPRGAISFSGFT